MDPARLDRQEQRDGQTDKLARLITVALFGAAIGLVALSAVAFVGVETLRDRVDRWAWTDRLAQAQFDLSIALNRHEERASDETEAQVISAFDELDAAIKTGDNEHSVSVTLSKEVTAARVSFFHNLNQRRQVERVVQTLANSTGQLQAFVSREIGAARLAESRSSRTSRDVEIGQRAEVGILSSVVDAQIAAYRIQSRLRAIMEYPEIVQSERAGVDLTGLPNACSEEASAQGELCTPSPLRVRQTIERLNTLTDSASRRAAAQQALWAVDAYMRRLRAVFEEKSSDLARSIDSSERERLVTTALSERVRGLARVGRAVQDMRRLVERLPAITPAGVEDLEREMTFLQQQIRQRASNLFSIAEVGEATSFQMADVSNALQSSWQSAVVAVKANHRGNAKLESSLRRMGGKISETAANVRDEAGGWIDAFTSSTIAALAVFGCAVVGGAVLAYQRVARPIARVTKLILGLAKGDIDRPIDGREGGATLSRLFGAMEVLRRSSVALRAAEEEAAAAARELERAHDRLTKIANNAPTGLYEFRLRPDGRAEFPYRSEAFDNLFGISLDDGANLEEIVFGSVHTDDLEPLNASIAQSAEHLAPWRHRFRVNHPTRGELWIAGASTPEREPNGSIHWVGTLTDITEQVRYESELNLARQKAEAANHAKSNFLANMSHEIRTPMNGIMGMCELLSDTELSNEQQLCTRTIGESAESLLTLINDVLDFSKIEAGKLAMASEPFSLSDLVYDVSRLLHAKAQEKGVELCIDFGDPFEQRIGDYGRVRQLLLNLLGNAVKFTETGHIVVRVRQASAQSFDLSIEDTGVGIDPADQQKIFRAFEQVDNEQTRSFDGTGLGLAICQQLVDLMDGKLSVRSTLGEGSEFTARLPLRATSAEPSVLPPSDLAGKRVLVVEVHGLVRDIISRQIQDLGATPVSAATGEAAFDALLAANSDAPIDFAIVGHFLPDMDLQDFMTSLAGTSGLPFPVVLHAPVDYMIDQRELTRIGFSGTLIRPASTFDVLRAAQPLLVGKTVQAPGSPRKSPQFAEDISNGAAPLNVLAADDNRTNQLVLKKMLQSMPVELALFANGQEILDAYRTTGADLVLMDLSMPVMDGLEATRQIRDHEKLSEWPQCPIVALTANVMAQHREACTSAGMTGFIPKPIKRKALAEAVDDAMRHRDDRMASEPPGQVRAIS